MKFPERKTSQFIFPFKDTLNLFERSFLVNVAPLFLVNVVPLHDWLQAIASDHESLQVISNANLNCNPNLGKEGGQFFSGPVVRIPIEIIQTVASHVYNFRHLIVK